MVTAAKPYGVFVDLGGVSGLLHISQISADHVRADAAGLTQRRVLDFCYH